ncbi:uncharacterized protein LOC129951355 [Eupeodes corollae]|uniref:uncharacterized protein LOC129951355 n=1 Tax=Eupeodes corollae TaxID=290404 RepID=UPI00248FD5B3|nr:uncharacterized protein LOC129951355 [Eupeodes corollae]
MAETSSFEDEILALNPEYDLVFSKYNENNNSGSNSPNALEPNTRWSSQHKMKIISKMNEIINAKPIGELPTQHDWDDQQSAEMETITLMRKLGLEQSVDKPPDEKRTISTIPTSEDVIFMKNGRKKMSIFMADAYFELKPRSEPSFDLDEGVDAAPNEESTTSDFSEDVNFYQPIFESSVETECTSLSEAEPGDRIQSRLGCDHLNERNLDSTRLKSQRKSSGNKCVVNDARRSYPRDGSKKGFNDSKSNSSSSSSNRSSKSWRSLNGSFSDVRDEKNWRLNVSKDTEPEKDEVKKQLQSEEQKEDLILNQTVTLSKETPKSDVVSSCGRTLYKPKDLFMKKKAMMIQQN